MKTRLKLPNLSLTALVFGVFVTAASGSAMAGAYDDLIAAAYRDDTDTVMSYVERGLDVNSVDQAGNTLLHIASRSGNTALISGLLKEKANPNARNHVGDTPLMLAAYNGKIDALDALLAGGARINLPGWTALHYAVFADRTEAVAELLQKGADVNARAPNKQTPLMLAAKSGNIEIAKLLLDAKADTTLKDQNGDTALTLAEKANNSEIARLISRPAHPTHTAPQAAAAPTPVPANADGDGEYVPPPFQTEK